MATAGRRKQPAQVLQLHGRREGKDSGGRDIPEPLPFKRQPPEAPEWLSAEARAEWDRVVPGLALLEILKPEDRAMLAAYCESWARFVAACKHVAEHGPSTQQTRTTSTNRGDTITRQMVVNPFVNVARDASKELRALANHFGLSPSAEMAFGKVESGGDGDENPFA